MLPALERDSKYGLKKLSASLFRHQTSTDAKDVYLLSSQFPASRRVKNCIFSFWASRYAL